MPGLSRQVKKRLWFARGLLGLDTLQEEAPDYSTPGLRT